MKRLSKEQQKQISDACALCQDAGEKLEKTIAAYNAAVGPLRDEVREALDIYNGTVTDLKSVFEEIGGEAQSYYDDRSEKWQEGETGQTYLEWVGQLESPADLDEIELEIPEDLEMPDEVPDFSDPTAFAPDEPGM